MSERFSANPNNLDIGADMPHVSRYLLGRGFVKPGEIVVDGACGHGYGSALLAEVAGGVYALDKDNVFNSEWQRENIIFKQTNLDKDEDFPECDAWISFETIEHLADPQRFLDVVTKVTKRCLVFSSPNKPTKAVHEFHLSDVLITNMQHYMGKYPDWLEYHSFMQGQHWILVYIKKGTEIL